MLEGVVSASKHAYRLRLQAQTFLHISLAAKKIRKDRESPTIDGKCVHKNTVEKHKEDPCITFSLKMYAG